jgi:hypothetical protein
VHLHRVSACVLQTPRWPADSDPSSRELKAEGQRFDTALTTLLMRLLNQRTADPSASPATSLSGEQDRQLVERIPQVLQGRVRARRIGSSSLAIRAG